MATPPAPQEAIDYLRGKGVSRGFSFRDVWRQEHQHAFTVAKMMDGALLADVQESLVKAQREGIPYAQWAKEMEDLMSRRGWWGKKTVTDPVTGEQVVEAQLGSSRRLQTIWRVNMRQASQVGVWERAQRSQSHPYLIYRVGPSKEHRQQHLTWDGTLLTKDDPWWSIANPSNGWGCKCFSRAVSAAQHRRYVRDGIAAPVQGDGAPGKKAVQTTAPTLRPIEYENPRTGQRFTGYAGISEGFEYNPGERTQREARQRDQFRAGDQRLAASAGLAPATPEGGMAVSSVLDPHAVRGTVKSALPHVAAAIDRVHGAAGLPPTDVIMFPDDSEPGGGYIAGKDRDRIGLRSSYEFPHLAVAHEIGHLIDRRGLPPSDKMATANPANWTREIHAWWHPIDSSERWRMLQEERHDAQMKLALLEKKLAGTAPAPEEVEAKKDLEWRVEEARYLMRTRETFARAYAQWIAWRSGSTSMLDEIDDTLRQQPPWHLAAWTHDDFLPIAAAFDRLMADQGWVTKTPSA